MRPVLAVDAEKPAAAGTKEIPQSNSNPTPQESVPALTDGADRAEQGADQAPADSVGASASMTITTALSDETANNWALARQAIQAIRSDSSYPATWDVDDRQQFVDALRDVIKICKPVEKAAA